MRERTCLARRTVQSLLPSGAESARSCWQGVGADHSACCGKLFAAEIILEELPSQLIVRDAWAQSLIDPVRLVHVVPEIDLDGSYAAAADSVPNARPTIVLELNDARPNIDAAKIGLPEQLLPHLSPASLRAVKVAAAPASGSWLRGSVVWNADEAEASPLAWLCVKAGRPGSWKALGGETLALASMLPLKSDDKGPGHTVR